MTIEGLVEKYRYSGVAINKRNIDYWSNLGMIPYYKDPKNGYRIYDEEAVKDLEIIIMLKALNARPLQQMYDLVKHNPILWNSVFMTAEKIMEYNKAMQEQRDTVIRQLEEASEAYEEYKKHVEGL